MNNAPVGQLDFSDLSNIERILLTTDGTLTEILQAYYREPINLIKLSEKITTSREIDILDVQAGEEVLERTILLQGRHSQKTFVYAESIIAIEKFDPSLRESMRNCLLNSDVPLGRLWLEHRLETFKEMVEQNQASANSINSFFNISKDHLMLLRTYRVFSQNKKIMLITEKFPRNYLD
jgi:chorismate-pyruvate lyase